MNLYTGARRRMERILPRLDVPLRLRPWAAAFRIRPVGIKPTSIRWSTDLIDCQPDGWDDNGGAGPMATSSRNLSIVVNRTQGLQERGLD